MRALLRSMVPDNFEDISAVLALYRPGPMGANAHNDYADRKNGRKPVVADPPRTRRAAGRHPGRHLRADRLPGAGHGDRPEGGRLLARQGRPAAPRRWARRRRRSSTRSSSPFSEGMRANGYSEAAIKTLWEILVPFSDYAFNKAHTAGYGLVSLLDRLPQGNYPAEYMAALLTRVKDDKDKSAVYLNECRRMGIKVLPPDVNESDSDFTPVGATSGSGSPRSATSARTSSTAIVQAARPEGPVQRLQRLHREGARSPSSTSASSSRSSRPARSTRSGDAPPGWCAVHEQARRRLDRHQAQRGDRAGLDLFGGLRRRRHAVARRGAPPTPLGGVGQGHAARLRAGDARALRVRPPAQRRRARAARPRGRVAVRRCTSTSGRPVTSSPSAASSRPCSAR